MSSVNEILNGNPYGLYSMTPKDVRMMKKKVLSHDFLPDSDKHPQETFASKFAKYLGRTIIKDRIKD